MRIKTLMQAFPDARFIYVLRDPHQVVPSFLSLLHKSIDFRWGIAPIPEPVLQRYYWRRYQAMIDLYRYFYDLQGAGELPEDRVMILPYSALVNDLQQAVDRIVKFTGMGVDKQMLKQIELQAVHQKDYRPEHQTMPLDCFGLTHEQIDKDFRFVFDHYQL